MDINAPDFYESFDLGKATVGIVGQGFVGNAVRAFFERKVRVLAYDKYKSGSDLKTLDEVVAESDIIFVGVPTPMREGTGECYTGIVESVLNDIAVKAAEIGRPSSSFVVVIKSTVPAGFTDKMRVRYPGARITFNPEFLTEANSVQDMLNANRVVIGGDIDDTQVVAQYFYAVDKQRVDDGDCMLVTCTAAEAEMTKLMGNGLLFARVLFCNEIKLLCDKLKIDYRNVAFMVGLDTRIGPHHMKVPGPDGHPGAGGHCFPKDMNNLKFTSQQLGTGERMFSAVLERNAEVRGDRDWEKMPDRAVTNK